MSRTRRDLESAYRHGTRVRIGGPSAARQAGAKGVLLHCQKRGGGGMYWRVRLQLSGEWVWPDDSMVVDGAGERVGTCGRCEMPFLRATDAELLCLRCDVEQFGTAAQRGDPAEVPYRVSDRGPYRRR